MPTTPTPGQGLGPDAGHSTQAANQAPHDVGDGMTDGMLVFPHYATVITIPCSVSALSISLRLLRVLL